MVYAEDLIVTVFHGKMLQGFFKAMIYHQCPQNRANSDTGANLMNNILGCV